MTEPAAAARTRGRRFRPLPEWAGRATRLAHGAQLPDLNAGAVTPPIYLTSTFRYPARYSEAARAGDVHLYSRERNPTVEEAAETIRELEGGESALLFASGMGAIAGTLLSLVGSGDTVVAPDILYGGTLAVLRDRLPKLGVRTCLLSEAESQLPEEAVGPGTRVVLLETPTNPLLRVHDLRRWAAATHRRGGVLVVDNTFASPVNQQPLAEGADLVVESATKYLGGHSDLTGGAVVGARPLLERIDDHHLFGAPLDPISAFLLQRSLKTLELRVGQQNRNAAHVLTSLAAEPTVARLHYPGRFSAEEEAIAARQMRGRGGVFAVSLRGGRAAVARFLDALQIVQVAASLGGVESLASVPRETSHRAYSDAECRARGIDDGLVRIALGIESPEDLARDLVTAVRAASPDGSVAAEAARPDGR